MLLTVFNDVINPMARIVTNISETSIFTKLTQFKILLHGTEDTCIIILNATDKYYSFCIALENADTESIMTC